MFKGKSQTKSILLSVQNKKKQPDTSSTRQRYFTQTSSTQSVVLVRQWMGRASFLFPAEITSMTRASREHITISYIVAKMIEPLCIQPIS